MMDLQNEACAFYRSYYEDPGDFSIREQFEIICECPHFFTEQEGNNVFDMVTLDEIHKILKGFSKSESPGPDGWLVTFFLEFFDIMGKDLLAMVGENRTKGLIPMAINSTFIALILKIAQPDSFGDFRQISLCNLIYKIIAVRIKPILSRCISQEQFDFLENQQILDVIGITQETMHSIKTKNINSIILQLDLSRAYDKVN